MTLCIDIYKYNKPHSMCQAHLFAIEFQLSHRAYNQQTFSVNCIVRPRTVHIGLIYSTVPWFWGPCPA